MAATTSFNDKYLAEMFVVGGLETPFLTIMGGLEGNAWRRVGDKDFKMSQLSSPRTPSQPQITEQQAMNGVAATSFSRTSEGNSIQLWQENVTVSYLAESTPLSITGDSVTHRVGMEAPVLSSESEYQILEHLKQISLDAEMTFLNGVYQQATDKDTFGGTRGVITACTSNTIAAAAAAFSTDMLDTLLGTISSNNNGFGNMYLFANEKQIKRVNAAYSDTRGTDSASSRNFAGIRVTEIETPILPLLNVVYTPLVPDDTILIADMAVIKPAFIPIVYNGQEHLILLEPKTTAGSAKKSLLYSQFGLDYGTEKYHGTLTGLAV